MTIFEQSSCNIRNIIKTNVLVRLLFYLHLILMYFTSLWATDNFALIPEELILRKSKNLSIFNIFPTDFATYMFGTFRFNIK